MLCSLKILFLILLTNSLFSQTFELAQSFGSGSNDLIQDITYDSNQNMYVIGYFTGTMDADPGVGTSNLVSFGSSGIYFAKYDSTGAFVWANSMGEGVGESGMQIECEDDHVYVYGYHNRTSDFDPGPGVNNISAPGNSDIFIGKYDADDGSMVWAYGVGSNQYDYGYGMDMDDDGNYLISGVISSSVDFDPGPGSSVVTNFAHINRDAFAVKYDSDLNFLWGIAVGDAGSDNSYGCLFDNSGNALITGKFEGTVDFDPGVGTHNLTSIGGGDVFLLKLDPNGNFLWAKSFGSIGNDAGTEIAVDSENNIFLTGNLAGDADIDPGVGTTNVTNVGNNDIFMIKFNSNGDFQWGHNFGSAGNDNGRAITCDIFDNIYLSGGFLATIDFDPSSNTNNLTSNGGYDNFITKYFQLFTPTLITNSVNRTGRNRVLASGNVSFNGNSEVIQKGIVWGTSPGPTINSNIGKSNEGGGIGSFTSSIGNLSLGTTYYFRSYATNSVGTSYGETISYNSPYAISVDGNQDVILDELQANVTTLKDIYDNDYITIVITSNNEIIESNTLLPSDNEFSYPFGLIDFKVNASQANVKLIYHGIEDLSSLSIRKMAADSSYFDLSDIEYSQSLLAEEKVGVISFTIEDGGIGDFDG